MTTSVTSDTTTDTTSLTSNKTTNVVFVIASFLIIAAFVAFYMLR